MIRLAEDSFSARTDPNQLDVDEEVIARLKEIHPATLSEHVEGDGPVVWILLIPTPLKTMERFLKKEIGEKEILNETRPGETCEALYLCSALVLPEFRGKGIAKKLTLNAISEIRKEHPIAALYVWPFSEEGDFLSKALAADTKLPLYFRED